MDSAAGFRRCGFPKLGSFETPRPHGPSKATPPKEIAGLIKGLLTYYYPPLSLNNPLIRPAISLGGALRGVPLDSHEDLKHLSPQGIWTTRVSRYLIIHL